MSSVGQLLRPCPTRTHRCTTDLNPTRSALHLKAKLGALPALHHTLPLHLGALHACPAATSGCTADLAAGVSQAVASQLATSAGNVTATCTSASTRRRRLAATSVALRVAVAYPSAQAAQQAQQVVLSAVSSGNFIASLTASLPTAGRELPGLSGYPGAAAGNQTVEVRSCGPGTPWVAFYT